MKSSRKLGRRSFNSMVAGVLVALCSPFLLSQMIAQCAVPPAGLVSWWRGETNALDQVGTNHGTLAGNPTYGAGRVGQGFGFDGNGAVVQLGNPASLHLQDLTIETWLRRTSPSVVSFNGGPGNGVIFGYDNGGYGLYLDPSGVPTFSKIGFNEVKPGVAITDTNWHHVAVTKVGSTVVFYVDGVAHLAAAYDPGFTFSGNSYLGGLGSFYTFYGTVDELSVYSRALATNEIQVIYNAGSSGKCVAVASSCAPAPAGLVGWWRGETNAVDQAGTNNGALAGNTTYGTGRVGQAFVLDGSGDGVSLGNPVSLQLQNFTIEAWIKRGSASIVSQDPYQSGIIFSYAWGGYGFVVWDDGRLFLTKNGSSAVFSTLAVTDTNLHHIAVTKLGSTVVFYLDGTGQTAEAYDPGFTFDGPVAIGARGGDLAASFLGTIDEVSVYNQQLTAGEIQAIYTAGSNGKCLATTPPLITSQPSNQTVSVGEIVTFNVTASGAAPLSYQWRMNSTNIAGATADSLVLTNVQPAAAGVYSVVVSNSGGTATSSNAVLTVNAASPATLLNVNFAAYDQVKTGFAATGQTGSDFWNSFTFPFQASVGFGGLKRVDGTATDAGLTVQNGAGHDGFAHPDLMYQSCCYAQGLGVITLTITNLPAGEYELYLYGHGGGSTANTVFQLLVGGNNFGNQSTATDSSWSLTNWVEGAQYVVYRGVTVTNGGAPVTVKCHPGVSGYTYLNGVQILAASQAPPVIASQPASQSVSVGADVTFSVTALGTGPLSYQWRMNSTNISGATADSLVLTNVQLAAAGVYSVVVSNLAGAATSSNATLTVNPLVACVTPASGLVSWWSGNGNASDLIGANNGIFGNGATFGAGEVGQGFSFNGGSNNVRIPAAASLDVGKSNGMTIEAWINPADLGQHPVAEWAPGGGYGPHIWINVLGPGSVYANLYDITGNEHLMQSAAGVISANAFQHLAVTYDKPSGLGRIIVNGVLVAEANLGSFTPLTSSDLYIGYRPPGAPFGPFPFNGIIDEVSLYARALSPGEVQAIYNAGSAGKCVPVPPPSCAPAPAGLVGWWRGETNALDQAGTNNGTLAGNATFGEGRVSQAFVFDGSGDGVSVGNAPELQLQTFTIESWIKRTSTSIVSQDPYQSGIVFSYGGGGYGFALWDDGRLFLTKNGASAVFSTLTVTDTNLHHIAVTKIGSTVVFYVDGIPETAAAYDPGFVFGGPAAIGARGGDLAASFVGAIDELSVYNRPLSAGEIQAIYSAGDNGKCLPGVLVAPIITSHPNTQIVTIGETVTFSVAALGAAPLSYQWRLNSTNIVGATADSLVLTNVQTAAAGVYSVVVSNTVGTAISSNATLTVNALLGCTSPPSGLVSWWRGEANAEDQAGGNNGTLVGNTAFGAGRVSQAFVFDGSGDGVSVGNPSSLQLQTFTIEAWIKRSNADRGSQDPYNSGLFFCYAWGGYAFALHDNGRLFLSKVGFSSVDSSLAITDTNNFHHVAVTKTGTNVIFYLDGIGQTVAPYDPGFTFDGPAAIGARGGDLVASFLGAVDELSVYNRPLSASEIQALYNAGGSGKCLTSIPAFIVSQPANKTVLVGGNTTFSVTAGGTPPFSYQWRFNGTSITNATNATLTLANVQGSQAGNYAVEVANGGVPVLSSNATLTVTYPVANVRLFGTNIVSGHPVKLPIQITANGNENAVSFSLNYTASRLSFRSAQLGDFPPGTYFFVNTSQTNLGRLGLTVALPSGATFAPGTQLLAGITFDAAISLAVSPVITQVGFGDQPMVRGLTDVNALTLPATYTAGTVTLSGTDLEGDAFPRPGGSRSFTLNDWVQAGRFAAKLDLPATDGEFRRVDAAPRGTAGDGQIKVMDWVQAGRYFAGMDLLTAVGGPSLEVAPTGPLGPDALREVRVIGANAIQDVAVTVPVVLQAQGNENGVGFTVSFDPVALSYQTASLGSGAPGANFNLNTNQVATGKLGLVLVLPTGSSFAPGARELVNVRLLPLGVESTPVTLSDQLVLRGVSDPAALELPASYVAGTVVVNPHPTLLIAQAGTNVALTWPALAGDFNLQSSTNAAGSGGWGEVLATPQAEGDSLKVMLPITDQTTYFRLRLP